MTKCGQYSFSRISFRIAEAFRTFHEMITRVLGYLEYVLTYIDDILLNSLGKTDNVEIREKVLEKIE